MNQLEGVNSEFFFVHILLLLVYMLQVTVVNWSCMLC